MATVNIQALMVNLAATSQNSMRPLMFEAAKNKLFFAKKELLKDFNESNVTQELKNGAKSDNISDTLGGYGNLASFIGFEGEMGSETAIEEVEKVLSDIKVETNMSPPKLGGNTMSFSFATTTPSIKELEDMTPYPSDKMSGSWLTGISKSITGILFYVYDVAGMGKSSRSTTGLQLEGIGGTAVKKNSGRWKPEKTYIAAFLDTFIKRLQGVK